MPGKRAFAIVDAFTTQQPFSGNPAGVLLLDQFLDRAWMQGVLIVTARSHQPGGVVSRYFAPVYGIPEDPVTGSAHCTIGPYWRDELGARLSAEQASARGGELTVVTTDAGRVRLAGKGPYGGHRVHSLTDTDETTCCNPAEQHMEPLRTRISTDSIAPLARRLPSPVSIRPCLLIGDAESRALSRKWVFGTGRHGRGYPNDKQRPLG